MRASCHHPALLRALPRATTSRPSAPAQTPKLPSTAPHSGPCRPCTASTAPAQRTLQRGCRDDAACGIDLPCGRQQHQLPHHGVHHRLLGLRAFIQRLADLHPHFLYTEGQHCSVPHSQPGSSGRHSLRAWERILFFQGGGGCCCKSSVGLPVGTSGCAQWFEVLEGNGLHWGERCSQGETGTIAPLLTKSVSAPWYPSHADNRFAVGWVGGGCIWGEGILAARSDRPFPQCDIPSG